MSRVTEGKEMKFDFGEKMVIVQEKYRKEKNCVGSIK